MLLLFSFVLVLFFVCVLFFMDTNMISMGTLEFRYYVVIIILLNLAKPYAIRD